MSQFFKFGQHVARVLHHHKTAGGLGDVAHTAGKMIGGWLGGGTKAVTNAAPAAAAKAAPVPHGGMTPLQRKMYSNETGQVAPKPRTVGEFEAARGGQGPVAIKGEGSLVPGRPAQPVGGPKLTPMEAAEMARRQDAGISYTMSPTQAKTPVAVRAYQQNAANRLAANGGDAADMQQTLGGSFKEYDARVAGAGRTPPPVPGPPPLRPGPLDDVDMSAPLTGAQKFNAGIK